MISVEDALGWVLFHNIKTNDYNLKISYLSLRDFFGDLVNSSQFYGFTTIPNDNIYCDHIK